MPLVIVLWCVAALLGTACLGIAIGPMRNAGAVIYGICLLTSLVALAAALAHLMGGTTATPQAMTLPLGLPWLGSHLRLDMLAAFFLVVVNLGAAAACLFAIGYGRHESAPERVLPFYPAFLAGMNLVVLADDAFTFLVSWEFMSLTSWALVMAHHRIRDNVYAGYVYLVMASFGTLCLLLAYGMLAGPMAATASPPSAPRHPSAGVAAAVLILALAGAGSKAGLVPLHVWLPLAHPAAPSHVSALMSGVMTKVAVYGFIRIVFDLLGPPDWWWSMVVLAIGGITAAMGVLYALMQTDLKRVLAYSTIENIGIIFIGLGLALAFTAHAMPSAAALALTAALFHVFNHSMFKSLLFFGAGAVLTATGERDMDRLGGLIHRMPSTSFAFLVGAVAISALPPFNGFVSEWLTFQAILLSPQLPQWGLKLLVPAVGALLALSAALAAACFVRAFGITFLGRARSAAAAQARETDRWSLAAMFALAAACLLAGTLPGYFIDALAPVVTAFVGESMPMQAGIDWHSIVPIAESRSSYNGLLVFLFIAISGSLAALAIHRLASAALRRGPAWDCGYPDASPATQYSAGSFAQPIRRVFGTLVFGAREHVAMPPPGDGRAARLTVELHDRAWEMIYAPIARRGRVRRRQSQPSAVPDHPALSQPRLRRPRRAASGARDMVVIRDLSVQAAQMLLVLLLAPLLTGFVRKVKARLLRRQGPPLIQPYLDLVRLTRKEVILAENASWLFRVAPYLIFAATWVAAALVPTFATGLMFNWSADLIAIIAFLGSARFFQALAGMDVGTSFGGIGSSREVMIASLAEPAMIMIVFTLALIAGSTQLSVIAGFMLSPSMGLRVSLGLALVALIMVAIAENGRIPVDNPATHLELTMVHEAMVLEYSGRHLALIELAASLRLLLYLSLIACVFAPWGLAAPDGAAAALMRSASPPMSASSRPAASCSPCSRSRLPRCASSGFRTCLERR